MNGSLAENTKDEPMTERKNVQTVTKWVASHDGEPRGRPWYIETDENVTPKPENARLYDSPSDVPDDCTPVRVRVETWEEEGGPETWDGKNEPNGFQIVVTTGGPGYVHLDSFTPVRIPTETKRKVTLDPEPTETGCRCRKVLEDTLFMLRQAGWYDTERDHIRRDMAALTASDARDLAWQIEDALADCDCKAPETVQ